MPQERPYVHHQGLTKVSTKCDADQLEKAAEPQLGVSDSAGEVSESLREIMRHNSASLDDLTKKVHD
jgi:hypothetical protein